MECQQSEADAVVGLLGWLASQTSANALRIPTCSAASGTEKGMEQTSKRAAGIFQSPS